MKNTLVMTAASLLLATPQGCVPANHHPQPPAPAPIFTYPIHADGGLVYDPLRREAEKTGQLARDANVEAREVSVQLGGLEAKFKVPVAARAYDVVPVGYVLRNTAAEASGPVHVSATAFEDPERRGGRDLADLSLPADIGVKFDFLGSVTATIRPGAPHLMAADLSDKPSDKYPNYDAGPLVRSGVVQAGDLVWFKFRITNTGNTILDPEGVGAFFLKPAIFRQKYDGNWEQTGIPYNRYIRILDYLYPGESTEVWINFMTDAKETPQGFGLLPGRYRIGIEGLARFEKDHDWLVNLWEGRTVARMEWDFTAAKEAIAVEPSSPRVTFENFGGQPRLNKWLHTFEEFMTSFESQLGGIPPGGEVRGTLHLQIAPWTKDVVVKLLTGDPPQIATAASPLSVSDETLEVALMPNAKNLVWKGGRWVPMVVTQTMADMRANIQLGPDVEGNARADIARMEESGISVVTTTGMPWLYEFIRFPYIHSQPTPESNQNGDAWKFFLDLARADGMPVEGWGNYPFARVTIGEVATWLTGKPFAFDTAWPMEASHADPKLPEANALVWLYHFRRWGDVFARNAAGQTPFSVEDTRGWLRMDLHIRYPHGPATIAAFRDWLKKQYSSLDKVNAAWGTRFAAWEEIDPERGQVVNRWDHRWEYSDSNNPFHDWSPAVLDFDSFRTELRAENYARTLEHLRKEVPSSALTLRTEGSNALVAGINPASPDPHLRHVYYSQRRNAMIAEILQKAGVLAYHSDYTTLPYTPREVRELTRACVKQGITPAWLPQFDHMRDIALNDKFGTDDYTRAYNVDRPVKATMMHVLTAVYPWWQATIGEGGVPGITWADYECDGFVTTTQAREMKLFENHLAIAAASPEVRKAVDAFPPPPPNPPAAAKRSFENAEPKPSNP
ncbi:MAG: hypothetical protein FGM15_06165 [Chthoniobacterales bacterium]|nr:hypothetical protein [Chthoniobacterales bacterium]